MGASDNVLRAGLTTKPRAVDELLRIGRFAPREPRRLRAAARASGVAVWETPAEVFELAAIDVAADGVAIEAPGSVAILLCLAGTVQVGTGPALRRGESCVVPAAAGRHRLTGAGRVCRAAVPPARAGSPPIR
jgi:mannose-6-phosphate isomerase